MNKVVLKLTLLLATDLKGIKLILETGLTSSMAADVRTTFTRQGTVQCTDHSLTIEWFYK